MARHCNQPNCTRPHFTANMCKLHYREAQHAGRYLGVGCPACGSPNTGVLDSRPTEDNRIRRRRQCAECGERYTTYEDYATNSPPDLRLLLTTLERATTELRKVVDVLP